MRDAPRTRSKGKEPEQWAEAEAEAAAEALRRESQSRVENVGHSSKKSTANECIYIRERRTDLSSRVVSDD